MKKIKDLRAKGVSAYMTLEASFIIPLSLFIFMLIIYFTFYLFNHCLVRQAVYIAGLRGQQLKNVSNSAIKGYVDEQLDELLDEQVFQYQIKYSSSVNVADIKIYASSHIDNKLYSLGIYNSKSLETDSKKTVLRFYPAEFIRLNHRGR